MWKGGRFDVFSTSMDRTAISTSPVAILGLRVSSDRRSTVPATATTNSGRSRFASVSRASSSRATTWVTP